MKIKKHYISHRKLSTIAIILLIFLFTPVKTHASTISLGIYPPLIKIKTPPNSHIQQNIIISNYGDDPTIVNISFKMFKSSVTKNGEIIFLPATTNAKNILSEQVKVLDGSIPINQVLLSPQQHKALTLAVTIPKEQRETDDYISILFISTNSEQIKSNATFVSQGVATNILLSVLPHPTQDLGFIKEVTGPQNIDTENSPFSIEAANQGIHYITAKGNIRIDNMLFASKHIIPLQPITILANSSRYMTNSLDTSLSQVIWKHGFLFGVYKADIALYFGNNPKAFHKVVYFYSYPTLGFGIGAIIIVFLGIVAFKISKKRS